MLNLNSLLQRINGGTGSTQGAELPAPKFKKNSDGQEILDGKARGRKMDIGEGGKLFQAGV
jgi:hypothetical protein